jgi:hypothetical protein
VRHLPGDPRDRSLAGFYRHLVASTAAQLMILVVGLARDAISAWCAALLVTASLGIAAHAYATVLPEHPKR